jgi:soluble lytic murein transglycosylase-like protein
MRYLIRSTCRSTLLAAALLAAPCAHAGNQLEEQMSHSVRAALSKAVSDQSAPFLAFATNSEARAWLDSMSHRLERRMPDRELREDFLATVHYEAKRAGLDPQMVLGLIQVESAFRKYAISSAGARGLMQVMPFWIDVIGTRDTNLFHLRTNLRFGCAILRHYLDMEKGDLFRALGRYNGSLGRPEYPNMVLAAWKQWDFNPTVATSGSVVKTGMER